MNASRSERARRQVLAVTADMVCEVGVERLTIDEVAARSGVAKTTIYRHWPNKQALVTEAVHCCMAPVLPPRDEDLRSGLLRCFDGAVRHGPDSRVGEMLLSLLDAAQRDRELDRLLRGYLDARRQPVVALLGAAVERGELPADCDVELAATLLAAPITYRKLIQRQAVTTPFLEGVVDAVLASARSGAIRTGAPSPTDRGPTDRAPGPEPLPDVSR